MPLTHRLTAILSSVLLILPLHLNAQVFPRGNGLSLSGVTQFDFYVQVSNWQGLPADPFEFRLQTQQLFEDKVTAAGVRRRAANRNYLVCNVQAARADGFVAYTATLEYWSLRSTDVHTLLWENGAISTAPVAEFNADLVATECAEYFVEEWSKWNPS